MSKLSWKRKIISAMEANDMYKDSFLPIIETLSEILDRRQKVLKQFVEEGSHYVIEKTSDRGAVNTAKNPLLGLIQECERDALSYWTALGMTPQSMKKALAKEKEEKEEEQSKGRKLISALANLHA